MTPEELAELEREILQLEIDVEKWQAKVRTAKKWNEEERVYLDRVYKAMMVTTNIDDCCALLRGEKVPRERLDQSKLLK